MSKPGFEKRSDLLFVGRLTGPSSDSPNVDSIVWFIREVMPILDRKMGSNYRLNLVGMLQSTEISDLLTERIVTHGVIDQLEPLFETSKVFVAPTRFAAGLPPKVVEAMARGVPCATTPLLKYQLGQISSAGIPSAGSFAEEVLRFYNDANAWSAAREAGLRHIAASFSLESFRSGIRAALAAQTT